ncbi:MAG: peptide-methionine (S)-S-oxide reductase MsrA [Proteobacteria bacterium]|nr:peptide-methionine (S)-S-oxide reductase MsrA [Pseudomonadota bacterium]HQR03978.1 peptide-methionine (S)-S-oxide reductase MsrA [Rhodocyclaceae bacterium]
MIEHATLGGGCFWCIEAALIQLDGVLSAVSGYSGGPLEHPDYHTVCTGQSGHAEVVRFDFDPQCIDYRTLLTAFFAVHDPTTPDRQGNDVGTQYRSVIYTHDPGQESVARQLIADLERQGVWDAPVVTEITPLEKFWPAEDYHQDYFTKNPHQGYCQAVVAPKVIKLRQAFRQRLKNR